MRLIKPKLFNAGDKTEIEKEMDISNVDFNIFKFNNRPKPLDSRNVLIICCFSEFGCEIVGSMFCIPELLRQNAGKYTVVVGWHGRDYLYRHLVDEFWEIKEEHMWLREYARAFHNESKNLKLIEKKLKQHGNVIPSEALGRLVIGVKCLSCGAIWGSTNKVPACVKCESKNLMQSLFGDIKNRKSELVRIPPPSDHKKEIVRQYLGPNPVGIFARSRKCYGRNLSPEFYMELIEKLESKGYTPIWLGEKQSTLPCPVDHIVDFSRMPESRDLEMTLAIVSQLKFTIQFWTASTRLAAITGTPYILFESPDQIWGNGQEGYRLNLCGFGPKKLVICHYLNFLNNPIQGMKLVDQAVEELAIGNESIKLGLLEDEKTVRDMMESNMERIGWNV